MKSKCKPKPLKSAFRALGYDRPTAQKLAKIARDKRRSGAANE